MNKRIPLLIGLLLTVVAVWLLITPEPHTRHFLERLNSLGYDLQIRTWILTKPPLTESDSHVAIIDIDDKSIRAEGRWPWPRSTLADLVERLREQGVAVIAFDIFFPEPQLNIANDILETLSKNNKLEKTVEDALKQNAYLFDEDDIFIKSITNNPTVLAYTFLPRVETQNHLPAPLFQLTAKDANELSILREEGYISNTPAIQQASKGSGFINIFPDEDGIVRRAPLLIEYKDAVYPAMALQAVLTYLDKTVELITPSYLGIKRLEGVKLGNYIIPTDSRGFVYIPFIGRSYTFPYFSAIDVLEKRIPPETLLGKIVFVGTSATGLGDLQPTSIQNPFPGVEIQASLVNGILNQDFSYKPAWTFGANVFITLMFGLIAAFLFPHLGPRVLALVIVLFPIATLYVNNMIWTSTGLILSVIMPVALVLFSAIFNLLYGYLFETRRREQLREMFGQYVPETHIDEMMKLQGTFAMHGEARDMSVMFADIRDFTTISESMNAEDLVKMLNMYFTPMTETIHKYMGTVDKYIGDLIMAFWGAPLRDKNHALHAIQTAIRMQKQLAEMRLQPGVEKWPRIYMGIGISSGIMNVGDMGSRFRRNYTVLGDTVNTASRVESLTKFYGVGIIVTEHTQRDQSKIVFRKLDRVQVKGKTEGMDLYEVIDFEAQVPPEIIRELEEYHRALNLFREQRFEEAESIFHKLHESHPSTQVYSIYLDRITHFKSNPPPADWDGTYVRVEK